MMNPVRWVRTAALGLFLAAVISRGENWPQFRGPRGDGTSAEKQAPVRWSSTENIRWKTAIEGEGHSSPIVWGNAVFLTTAGTQTGERLLLRLDADTGKIAWKKRVLTAPKERMHGENSSASSTPATDGKYIFTSFQAGDRVDIRCFDFEGNELWAIQPLSFNGEHGYSYSPVADGPLVYLDCRQEGEAALLAIEKSTGKIRWRATPSKRRISHIAPLIIDDGSKKQLIVSGSNETKAYDPISGKPIWWCTGPSDVSVAGMVYGEGMVFTTAGYPARTRMAIRVSGKGDVSNSHVAWSLRRQVTYVPSPVYSDGHVYTVLDEGMAICLDAGSGETVWEERLGGRFRSSLVLVGGQIYATNDKGQTTVFEANPKEFRLVSKNELNEFCYATPAVSNGRIFLRTGSNLYCIEENSRQAKKLSPQPKNF